MKIKKIFVTGATGFIGSNIVKMLVEKGYEVHALIKKQSNIRLIEDMKDKIHILEYEGDIQSLIIYFERTSPDLVIHLASLFLADHKAEDIENLIKSNILLGTQILEAMTKSDTKKIINTSTSWQHYNNEEYNPVCLYAATKQAFEDVLKYYVEAKGISAINLTLFDTYGANDIRNKIINKLYEISNTRECLNMSYGEQEIDLIYISDIVEAYINAIEKLEKDSVNGKMLKYYLNSDQPKKLKEVVEIFEKINNKKLNINWGSRPYREREIMKVYKTEERLPGWNPKYSLEKGFTEIKRIMKEKS